MGVGVVVIVVVEVGVGVAEAEGVVGTTMTAVEDGGGGGGDDEGRTYVIEVPRRTPEVVSPCLKSKIELSTHILYRRNESPASSIRRWEHQGKNCIQQPYCS